MPAAGFRGIFKMTFLRHVTVLSGVGVGGGSLVYANTLPTPKDEFFTTQVVSKGKLLSNIAGKEGTPPLYFIAVWGWTKLFGDTDTAFRSLSAIVGTATVPLAYAAAWELARSRRVARVAAVLVAVNPLFVWFSQEARAYSLFAFVGTLSLLFCVRARTRGRTHDLVLWGVASAAALSTHYFAIFLVLPEAVWLLLSHRRRWRRVLVGCIPLAVAGPFLYLFFSAQHAADNQDWITKTALGFRIAEAGRQSLIGPGGPDDRLWALGAALVLVAAVLVVVRGDRRERSAFAVMVALGATGLVLPVAGAAIGSDYFLGRNLIASLVPLAIAVAIGLGAVRAGWIGATATAGLCVLSTLIVVAVASDVDLQKADWRSLAALLDTVPSDSAVVIDHDGHLAEPLLRYLRSARVLRANESVRVRPARAEERAAQNRRLLDLDDPIQQRSTVGVAVAEHQAEGVEGEASVVHDHRDEGDGDTVVEPHTGDRQAVNGAVEDCGHDRG